MNCRISNDVDAGIAKRQTAAVYLKAIASEGFLEVVKAGCETLYVNSRLLTLLSDKAQTEVFWNDIGLQQICRVHSRTRMQCLRSAKHRHIQSLGLKRT